ncbi:MAG: hypothetical protein KKA07_07050, partial [Bacteroidetes bacterium]|nr:hypothetical protein [Bacteroidota bacterium]
MNKRLILFVSLCLTGIALFAQSHKSIMQEESEYYGQFHFGQPVPNDVNSPAASDNDRSQRTCTLTKTVFGFHPYWNSGLEQNYDWNNLTDLCFFSYEFSPSTGAVTNSHSWATNSAVTTAISHGCRVHLCVSLFTDHATFLTNATARGALINDLILAVQSRGGQGINIDFEGISSAQKTNFTTFISEISDAFHTQIPGSIVSVCIPYADFSSSYDVAAMSTVDWFIIQGYDYYYSGSSTAGPVDPLYAYQTSYNYCSSKSVNTYLKLGVNSEKFILCMPYYGRSWQVSSTSLPSPATASGSSVTLKTRRDNASGYYSTELWDSSSFMPYFNYQNGNWFQCWIDNVYSLGRKYDMVLQRNLGGIGIWALGYDDGYSDYWNLISDKFSDCATIPCTDSIFDMGGPNRNYNNGEDWVYTISPTGADVVSLQFSDFFIESGFDTLRIYNGSNTSAPLIGTYSGTNSPGTLVSSGPSLTLQFKSDASTTNAGWRAVWECSIDSIPPESHINTDQEWKIVDFNTSITDTDNPGGTGVESRFYLVADFIDHWSANPNHGFFKDEFDTLDQNIWQTPANYGTWSVSNNSLEQADSTKAITNIYAAMEQDSSDEFLYHFITKFNSGPITSYDRCIALHFASDSAQAANRNNGYSVLLNRDLSQLEWFRSENNINYQKHIIQNVPFYQNTWYDVKIVRNKLSAEISVYINNQFIGAWTDPSPLTTPGDYISFQTSNCCASFSDLEVFKSHSDTVLVSIGNTDSDIRYQSRINLTDTIPSGLIESIAIDHANNISETSLSYQLIDWTGPEPVTIVNDGPAADIDTLSACSALLVNWNSTVDQESGVHRYFYSIGSGPGDVDVLGWQDNGTGTTVEVTGITLTAGLSYFVNVKSENNAGLESSVSSSDGFIVTSGQSYIHSITQCFGDSIFLQNAWQTVSGTYTDSLTGSLGCDSIIISHLTVRPEIIPTLTNDTAICQGNSLVLTAGGGSTYKWSNNKFTASITVTPLSTTTYTVTVYGPAGCSASDAVTVTVNPTPTATVSITNGSCGQHNGEATVIA